MFPFSFVDLEMSFQLIGEREAFRHVECYGAEILEQHEQCLRNTSSVDRAQRWAGGGLPRINSEHTGLFEKNVKAAFGKTLRAEEVLILSSLTARTWAVT